MSTIAQRPSTAQQRQPPAQTMPPKKRQATLEEMMGRAPSPDAKRARVEAFDAASVAAPDSLAALVATLADGLEGDYEAQQQKLKRVAASLMTHFTLDINGTAYRLAEVEAYVYHKTHQDVYTHKMDEQLESACWYFHRQGATKRVYKGGTYKGLDLTAGCRATGMYAGFLVRSIISVQDGKHIEGPCLCVNRILELNKKSSIEELVGDSEGSPLSASQFEGLKLVPASTPPASSAVYAGPRVGLTLRQGRERFCARPYRFSTIPHLLGKLKAGFAAVAVVEGVSSAAVMDAFNMKPKIGGEVVAATLTGMKHNDYSRFQDKVLNGKEMAELVGASRKSF